MNLNIVMKHKRHKHRENIIHGIDEVVAESSYDSYSDVHNAVKSGLTDFVPVDIMKKKKEIFKINKQGEIETIKEKQDKSKIRNFSFFDLNNIGVGYNLVIPLLLGVLLGLFLDNFLKTGNHFFTAIFILIGLFSSLYNLFKLTKKENAAH